MNSLTLLLTAAVAFIFGYRFYSKLLALTVFRPDENNNAAASHPIQEEGGAVNRYVVFGHHVSALAAGATVTGTLVALIWGWMPAFLWVVLGSVIAAGTYGIGGLWLSRRYPGLSPAEIAVPLTGANAYLVFTGLSFFLLLIINAACVVLAAQLLTAFPETVLPFGATAVIALVLGKYLRVRQNFGVILASLIALALTLTALWLLAKFPVQLHGTLSLEIPGRAAVTLDASATWIMLMLLYAYSANRAPMGQFLRPQAYLTALLLGIVLFIFCISVAFDHPDLTILQFHATAGIPNVIPWLFVTLTSGAFAGFHLLIANGISAPYLERASDARWVGYGGALVIGLLAVSAVIVGSIDAGGAAAGNVAWSSLKDLSHLLALYINGMGNLAAGIGLDALLSQRLTALVVIGLLSATLGAGIFLQKQMLFKLGARQGISLLEAEKTCLRIAVLLCAAVAVLDRNAHTGFTLWPIYGIADQLFAIFGLMLIALALARARQPASIVLALLVVLLVAINWALMAQLYEWWSEDKRWLFAIGFMLLVAELGLARMSLKAIRRHFTLPA